MKIHYLMLWVFFSLVSFVKKDHRTTFFSKFYGKVGVISWLHFHLIWKTYLLYWDFDLKSWIMDFFTHSRKNTSFNNFSGQNFSVENNFSNTVRDIFLVFPNFSTFRRKLFSSYSFERNNGTKNEVIIQPFCPSVFWELLLPSVSSIPSLSFFSNCNL